MSELVWFNISVTYSAICAAYAVQSTGRLQLLMIFLAVHGGLWAIYRAIAVHAKTDLKNERP